MKSGLEEMNSALQARILGLNRLHLAITYEQNHVTDLMRLRATATRLIARGHGKAFRIVRAIDAKLEKVQARTNAVSSILIELEEKLAFLHSKE